MDLLRAPRYDLTGLDIVLAEDRPLRLTHAQGVRLRCTSGRAWITAPGVFEDILLLAGDAWEVGSDGLVLVEAIGRATVSVDS